MSGGLDDDARELAFELLDEFGKPCTLNKLTQGTRDAATGKRPMTTTSYPINLYLDQPNLQELQGGQVLAGQEVAVFAALGLSVEPQPNDTITVDGVDRVVSKVTRIWSGAQVALWRAALKS